MEISVSALTIAIKAINRDIKVRETALDTGSVDEQHLEECGQYVLDMHRSQAELISTYEEARLIDRDLPTVDALLSAPYP